MSSIKKVILKQPLKIIEIPLNKFKEDVVPFHQNVFEEHKNLVMKLISVNDYKQALQRVKDKKRRVKQLKDLMYELDTLRTQVEDYDLDKFDNKTVSLRKIILSLINGYAELEKHLSKFDIPPETPEERNPFEGAEPIRIQHYLDFELEQQQNTLNRVEEIHREVEDLHEIYSTLNGMVNEQGDDVEHIEGATETSNQNVQAGLRDLIKANRMKAAVYPVTGAFIGSIIGGPVGFLAGFKVGGLAALGCGLLGYTGGKMIKKINEENEENEHRENMRVAEENTEKKRI